MQENKQLPTWTTLSFPALLINLLPVLKEIVFSAVTRVTPTRILVGHIVTSDGLITAITNWMIGILSFNQSGFNFVGTAPDGAFNL